MGSKVEKVLLQSNRASIMQTTVNSYRAPGDHHDRGEIERVKGDPGDRLPSIHHIQRKSKDVSTIATLALQFEVNPAKHQRESNHRRDDATPHDQLMHQPARETTTKDKLLDRHSTDYGLRCAACISNQVLSVAK